MREADRQWFTKNGAKPGEAGIPPITPSASPGRSAGAETDLSGLWAIREVLLAPARLCVDAFRLWWFRPMALNEEMGRIGVLCQKLASQTDWRPTHQFKDYADPIPQLMVLEIIWVRMHNEICEIRISPAFSASLKDAVTVERLASRVENSGRGQSRAQ